MTFARHLGKYRASNTLTNLGFRTIILRLILSMKQTEFTAKISTLILPPGKEALILSISKRLTVQQRAEFFVELQKISSEYKKHIREITACLEKAEQSVRTSEKVVRTSKENLERSDEILFAERMLNS